MKINHISKSAKLGRGCQVGFFSVISENVQLGENAYIGNSVTVYPGVIIGSGVSIGDNSVVGKQPHPGKTSTVKYEKPLPPLKINDGTIVGAGAVLYAGSYIGENVLVGDLASIREESFIGDSTIVGRGVAVENKVKIGSHVKIQTNAYITAYTTVADHVFIAPCVITTNDNKMGRTETRFAHKKGALIERGSRVGAGAIILPGITVAEETFVAAGSLVTRDTPDGKLIMGHPARVHKDVSEGEFLKSNS
ncbi:MAG: acyltransferase [Desulfotomaculaceae bacterium]